jgi:hypothetical protein
MILRLFPSSNLSLEIALESSAAAIATQAPGTIPAIQLLAQHFIDHHVFSICD